MKSFVTQALTIPNTYFLFRPIYGGGYSEVPFRVISGKIHQHLTNKLTKDEKIFIQDEILHIKNRPKVDF